VRTSVIKEALLAERARSASLGAGGARDTFSVWSSILEDQSQRRSDNQPIVLAYTSLKYCVRTEVNPFCNTYRITLIGNGAVFAKGRDFGAWLGLVPKQISTGDRTILGAISRRGNRYLRVLFVQAAWVVLARIKDWDRYGLKAWIDAAKCDMEAGRSRTPPGGVAGPQ
jgi:hypothetical protein